ATNNPCLMFQNPLNHQPKEKRLNYEKVQLIHDMSYQSIVVMVDSIATLKLALQLSTAFAAHKIEDDQLIQDLALNFQTVIGGLKMRINSIREYKTTNNLVDIITGANTFPQGRLLLIAGFGNLTSTLMDM
ncbi:hypothetical protein MJO29_005498, partial [Puccinia striiformis f. sp. tritici]